jgi:phospholipid/cholesterol/gamma-HCH transport system ATP-binding protein
MQRTSMNRAVEVINVEDLTLAYGQTVVLENVSFSVYEGEAVSILGASGCGKTTLLRAMIGLLPPRKGWICLAGEKIVNGETRAQARKHIGVLFQSGALLASLTIAENVALPLEEFTDLPLELIDEIVQMKLDLVKLGRFGHLMPAQLSGGMLKRAGLARAIAMDPKILLCDEPCAALDPKTALEIDGLLIELNAALGVTLVVVTHEVASIENISDRCIMLDSESRGIIASGSPEALKNDQHPSVRSFFERQVPRRPALEK